MLEKDNEMIEEIDLRENAVYVVKDGHCTMLGPMKSGTDEIVWKDGSVLDVVRSNRIRLGKNPIIKEN